MARGDSWYAVATGPDASAREAMNHTGRCHTAPPRACYFEPRVLQTREACISSRGAVTGDLPRNAAHLSSPPDGAVAGGARSEPAAGTAELCLRYCNGSSKDEIRHA